MRLTEPVNPMKLVEFVAWYRGALEAMKDERISPYFDPEKVKEAYVRDVEAVLDALEMVSKVQLERNG